jgi:hypothetical protein
MKNNTTLATGDQLWGIYYTDREYAREMGDPIRTVVEAPTKRAAEQAAVRLGFGDPWAHLVTPEQARQAQWLCQRQGNHRHQLERKPSYGVRI